MRGGEQPTKKDFINHMLNEQRGGGRPTPNPPTSDLPDWVLNCLKNTKKPLKKTPDTNKVEYVNSKGDKEYYFNDFKYLYVFQNGKEVEGNWSCVDDVLYISVANRLFDGEQNKWLNAITDSKLLEKLKNYNDGGKFKDLITTEIPSLFSKFGNWFYDKVDDLKGWWKNYQKEHGNSSSSNGIYTTKGDPYQYKVVDCVWYTKSRENRGKIIKNWLSLEDNENANNILDKRFPKARKECKKTDDNQIDDNQTDGGQTITTPPKPEPPKIILPDWAKCIGDSIEVVNVTKDENNLDIVFSPFGKSKGYFWNDGAFMFVYENGNKVAGKWSCDNNKLLITTDDGDQWTPSTQWITQPSKYINPSVHNSTTSVAVTDLVDDESTPTETTQSDKPDSTDEFKSVDLPKDIGFKPSKPDIKNESYNSLEDVLNNINLLINEIEMKEIIREQKQSVVNAPAEELDILYGNAVLKTMGPVVTLCESGPTPIPVNVEGRMYFAGRKNKLKPGYSATEGYFVYDGRVLARTQGCNFVYVKKGNEIAEISGMETKGLELPSKELLSRFGINNMDYNSNPYYFIDTITKKFQDLIDEGARSRVFGLWQDLLINYYKYDNTKRLKLTTENKNDPPQDELYQYRLTNANNLGIKYLDKEIQIWRPLEAAVVTGAKKVKYDPVGCQVELKTYLSSAFEFMLNGQNNPNVNINTVREHLRGCYSHGMFDKDKFKGLRQDDLDVQFSKDNNPFTFWKQGSVLSIDNIKELLTGRNRNLPIVSGGRKNPYLNFYIDTMRESTSNITNLIKENLTKIKREKDSSLLIETKIVKSRTELLTENRILKFKQPREKFFNEIISEAMYLNKQGFDKQIIKEEFWDSLKGLFGEHGSNAIFTTFKEYMGKYLVGKLTSINPNGWMGENIKEAINKIHIEDLDKITDCNFISRKISTSITDSIISKVSKGQDIEGGNISSIVKGGLDKSIDRTELTKNIHEGITKLICPVLGDVSKKLKEKGEEMKLKAVKP